MKADVKEYNRTFTSNNMFHFHVMVQKRIHFIARDCNYLSLHLILIPKSKFLQ
jgi:hypothetical protein